LDFGVRWDRVDRSVLAAFKEWRLSAQDNPGHVAPASFKTDLSALRRFYLWAAEQGVENPVRLRVIGTTFFGEEKTALEATPSGIRRADVKWLTPEAFRLWRNLGLRGFTAEGLPGPHWRGRTEDRDVAFVEGLFGTGLRLGEWSSQLTVELPAAAGEGLCRGWVASACAKGAVGRPFWLRRRVAQLARSTWRRGAGVRRWPGRNIRAGYEQVLDRWLVRRVRSDGVLDVVDERGTGRGVRLDVLTLALRMRLFREGPDGLEPLWLWLNDDGTPRPKQAWHKTFARANARVDKALATPGGGRPAVGAPAHAPALVRVALVLHRHVRGMAAHRGV